MGPQRSASANLRGTPGRGPSSEGRTVARRKWTDGPAALQGAVISTDADILRQEAARLRASGALGRSEALTRLFDYLVERSTVDAAPKEVEVAMDVFGRGADFEPGRDAAVRVYAHKLRSRLASAYQAEPGRQGPRLVVPRGEYRLLLAPADAPVAEEVEPAPAVAAAPPRRRLWIAGLAALALLLAGALGWWAAHAGEGPAARELAAVRRGPVWGPLLANDRPTVVVLGDYYIFGESENGMEISRLVREYTVNSREELTDFVSSHPEKRDRYLDLDLRYLPIGAGSALRDVSAVLAARPREQVRVMLMSDLTPAVLKTSNVVYIGYLSGMGWLRDVVLAPSRFRIGDTFDDVIDRRSGVHYASQGGRSDADGGMYRDYGYLSTFPGPAGGRVVVIAGTRDAALMQAAEDGTRAARLREAVTRADGAPAFEALYEVDGMNRLNVGGRLVTASPLDGRRLWTGGAPPRAGAPPG